MSGIFGLNAFKGALCEHVFVLCVKHSSVGKLVYVDDVFWLSSVKHVGCASFA